MAFDKILIANRGEIALRVIKTARALGYPTVAVFSSADRDAPHVAAADEAVWIGAPAAAESYLVVERVLDAAKRTGANAVHPGYGFLSENAAFARACADAGVTFIGPRPEAIELMGNKRGAKLAMIAAGVPCVPGYQGEAQAVDVLMKAAASIGYPLMVKAAAGGGGRGMRLVSAAEELREAIESAAREAASAFGSGELILEKAIVGPRHVEVQVFGDSHGNVIHLGERDCSVQRRHQKVIEESPSPAVDDAKRAAMGAAAVKAAKACDYVGAGTVELLLDESGAFYFLEMNTRLQVEHPVTEMVTGLDLVAWQIRVARGEPLPLSQEQVTLTGHAIEARLYAEDPRRGYMPQTGSVLCWRKPRGIDVRIDDGIADGSVVGAHYDALLAKVIAHGATRDDARRKLRLALSRLTLFGVTSNKALLGAIVDDPTFAEGGATTALLAQPSAALAAALAIAEPSLGDYAAAALAVYLEGARGLCDDDSFVGFRSGGPVWIAIKLAVGEFESELRVMAEGRGAHGRIYSVARGRDERVDVVVVDASAEHMVLWVDAVRRDVRYQLAGDVVWTDDGRATHRFDNVTHRAAHAADAVGSGKLVAPLDGAVTRVLVEPGALVTVGELLIVVEAMKMEHRIEADVAGSVANLSVKVGDQVKSRQLLCEIATGGEV